MKRILISLLLLLPPAAHAEPSDEAFAGWVPLTQRLRAEGVDPVAVPWQPIDMRCLSARDAGGEVPYNRCKYELARRWAAHATQANTCRRRANRELTLLSHPPVQVVERVRAETGRPLSITYAQTLPPIGRARHELRAASFESCMDALGWSDPYDGLAGRIEASH